MSLCINCLGFVCADLMSVGVAGEIGSRGHIVCSWELQRDKNA